MPHLLSRLVPLASSLLQRFLASLPHALRCQKREVFARFCTWEFFVAIPSMTKLPSPGHFDFCQGAVFRRPFGWWAPSLHEQRGRFYMWHLQCRWQPATKLGAPTGIAARYLFILLLMLNLENETGNANV